VKKESTIKFQVLGKIYSILGDEEKKKLYDESGVIDGEDDEGMFSSNVKDWEKYWRSLFKKISREDIDSFFQTYKNSAEERADLIKFYEKHKGDMDLILEEVFSEDSSEDEPRFREILNDAIEKGECKKFAKFVNESKSKIGKRKANFEKEALEAEEMRQELGIDESADDAALRNLIVARGKARTHAFMDKFEKKYAPKSAGKAAGKKGKKAGGDASSNQENEMDDEFDEVVEASVSSGKKKSAAAAAASKQADSHVKTNGKRVKRL
jgi:DnaJ family protein C protein 9